MSKLNFITVADAALRLGISARRVRRLCQDGLLAHVRVTDRMLMVDAAALATFKRRPPGRPKK